MMLSANAAGWPTSAGARPPISTIVVATAATVNRIADRAPFRAATIAAITGRAGQAVAFIAQAAPMVTPASPVQATHRAATRSGGRAAQARPRHIRAITGVSVVPRAIGSARTGEATARAALRATELRTTGLRHTGLPTTGLPNTGLPTMGLPNAGSPNAGLIAAGDRPGAPRQ